MISKILEYAALLVLNLSSLYLGVKSNLFMVQNLVGSHQENLFPGRPFILVKLIIATVIVIGFDISSTILISRAYVARKKGKNSWYG